MKKLFLSLLVVLSTSCQNQQISNNIDVLEASSVKANLTKKIVSIKKPSKIIQKNVNTNLPRIKADSSSLFPIEQGYTWNYDVVFHPTDDPYVDYTGTATVSIEKTTKNKNETILELRAIDSANNEYTFPFIKMTDKNISFSGVSYLGFGSVENRDVNVDFLHLPMKSGEKWDEGLWSIETKELSKVTIPSGSYDAWVVNVIGTYDHQYTAVGKYWLVAGIGIVKYELSVPGWTLESVLTTTKKK